MTNTDNLYALHAHVSTVEVSCDGPIARTYVMRLEEDEMAKSRACNGVNDFIDIEFRERVLLSQMSVYSTIQGTLSVDETGFHWRENTEEGYRASSVEWCHDNCASESTYRDVYAEAMGY